MFRACNSLTNISVACGNHRYYSVDNCIIESNSDNNKLVAGCNASIVPDDGSITSIGESAFNSMEGLISITIPNGVIEIDGYAFINCINLENVTIPDSVTSIGKCAFNNCGRLTSIIIPDSVINIGERAFSYHSGLTSVTMPKHLKKHLKEAFDKETIKRAKFTFTK